MAQGACDKVEVSRLFLQKERYVLLPRSGLFSWTGRRDLRAGFKVSDPHRLLRLFISEGDLPRAWTHSPMRGVDDGQGRCAARSPTRDAPNKMPSDKHPFSPLRDADLGIDIRSISASNRASIQLAARQGAALTRPLHRRAAHSCNSSHSDTDSHSRNGRNHRVDHWPASDQRH